MSILSLILLGGLILSLIKGASRIISGLLTLAFILAAVAALSGWGPTGITPVDWLQDTLAPLWNWLGNFLNQGFELFRQSLARLIQSIFQAFPRVFNA